MRLHLESLDLGRKIFFEKLGGFRKFGYLAGGTALALQIGHRISYDFDIFCFKEISDTLLRKTRQAFSVQKILVNSKEEFTFVIKNEIKISFIYYPFKLDKFILKREKGLNLLSSKGIAVAKAYTLGRRGSWRDYVDLFFILKTKKVQLKEIIIQAEKIYGEFFSEKLFLTQLVYTEDIDKKEILETKFLGKKTTLKQVKNCFKKEIDKYIFIKREAEADKDIARGRVIGPFKSIKGLLRTLKKKK